MPELPEVETVRRVLEPQLSSRKIESVSLLNAHVIAHPAADAFIAGLCGQTITALDRRGKYLIIRFESSDRILVHLRMTGALLVTPNDDPLNKHLHIALQLNNAQQLRFYDQRRFGRMWFFRKDETDSISGVQHLGLEPSDPALTGSFLASHLQSSRRAIKTCLLDQSIVAGIGNIYADESLHAAGISPALPANQLTEAQWECLAQTIPTIISFATEKNAISPADYLFGRGSDYRNTPFLAVYGRAGTPCRRCGELLSRTVIGGRGTVFCPNCQH